MGSVGFIFEKILIIDRKNSDLQVATLSLSLETISSISKLSSWLSKYFPRNTMNSPILVLISVSLQIWIGKTTANSSKHGVLKQVIDSLLIFLACTSKNQSQRIIMPV